MTTGIARSPDDEADDMTARVMVDIEGLTVRYGDHQVLHEISITIADGELLALLGPSGCGKTTLLRSIAGLTQPASGTIAIDGRVITDELTRRRPIGMVFQAYALFPNMRAVDNVAFPLRVSGTERRLARSKAREYLELVGLGALAHRYPHELSGGQQQRVALARALVREPRVLLLDEPLSALDAQVRVALRDEIRRLQQELRITTIYVTHDQAEALAIADRVALMNSGRIEQLAAPEDIYYDPATRFAAEFVGTRNTLLLPVVNRAVDLGGVRLPAPTANGMALIAFRPEDARIRPADDPGVSGLSGTVHVRMFLGPTTRLFVHANDGRQTCEIQADIPSRDAHRFTPGAPVVVEIPADAISVFSAGEPNA